MVRCLVAAVFLLGACSEPGAGSGTAEPIECTCPSGQRCDIAGQCQAICTVTEDCGHCGVCGPNLLCQSAPCRCDVAADCSDGDGCNGAEVCEAGLCAPPAEPFACPAPGNSCFDAVCVDSGAGPECTNVPKDQCPCGSSADCDDGDPCTGTETCAGGFCSVGQPFGCPENAIACRVQQCAVGVDGLPGCVEVVSAEGTACESDVPCSGPGTCSAGGACLATPLPGVCPCADNSECDDGDSCNGVEVCTAGSCIVGQTFQCPAPAAACVVSECFDNQGVPQCVETVAPAGVTCETDDVCQVADGLCDATGTCSGAAIVCDDGLPCTMDACDETTGACTATPDDSLCDDGKVCTTDACDSALGCVATAVDTACDDGVGCTEDSCDLTLGCVFAGNDSNCDDGVDCTVDTCTDSGCTAEPNDVLCEDDYACTAHTCDAQDGCVIEALDHQYCDDTEPPLTTVMAQCNTHRCDADTGCIVKPQKNQVNAETGQPYPIQCGVADPCTAWGVCDQSTGACVPAQSEPDYEPCGGGKFCFGWPYSTCTSVTSTTAEITTDDTLTSTQYGKNVIPLNLSPRPFYTAASVGFRMMFTYEAVAPMSFTEGQWPSANRFAVAGLDESSGDFESMFHWIWDDCSKSAADPNTHKSIDVSSLLGYGDDFALLQRSVGCQAVGNAWSWKGVTSTSWLNYEPDHKYNKELLAIGFSKVTSTLAFKNIANFNDTTEFYVGGQLSSGKAAVAHCRYTSDTVYACDDIMWAADGTVSSIGLTKAGWDTYYGMVVTVKDGNTVETWFDATQTGVLNAKALNTYNGTVRGAIRIPGDSFAEEAVLHYGDSGMAIYCINPPGFDCQQLPNMPNVNFSDGMVTDDGRVILVGKGGSNVMVSWMPNASLLTGPGMLTLPNSSATIVGIAGIPGRLEMVGYIPNSHLVQRWTLLSQ